MSAIGRKATGSMKDLGAVFVLILIAPLLGCGQSINPSFCVVIDQINKDQVVRNLENFIADNKLNPDRNHPAYVALHKQGKYKLVISQLADDVIASLYFAKNTGINETKIMSSIEVALSNNESKSCKEAGVNNVFTTGEI